MTAHSDPRSAEKPERRQPTARTVDLTVRYRDRTALNDVSMDIGRGVTGLLGPNGAGKTTLLRILATVQAPTRGRIEVFGVTPDTRALLRETRRRLGYLPQNPGLYPNFTVRAFALHFAALKEIAGRSARRAEADRVLQSVGLGDRATVKIKTLSGGMRQRLALACAMIGRPDLLILDEPTVGLDPEQRMGFRELIADLGQRHSVLLSTHQTDDVAWLCNRVVVLDEGSVRFTGEPADLTRTAEGKVWLSPARDAGAVAGWFIGQGEYRNIGSPPPGAKLVEPTLEDGYLLAMGSFISSGVNGS
ncbi:ABC transporter ATP-binding protein [Streptomyces hirsutus]|uniref:ABC transporter ATP-binding protein n=1 Tax=Streptomyces hirsutus TaxID=35620 RepID=UPI00368781C2